MAIDFPPQHKRGSEYLFAPEDIAIPAEMNGRHDLPDITHLIKSIEKYGQLQPVVIRNDGGTPTLVAGFSRWRAICEINGTRPAGEKTPVRCIPVRCDENQGLLRNIHENRQRNPTTPLDDAYNMQKLEQMGKSIAEIAEEYGESAQWVSGRLSLLSLAPEAKQALSSGKMKVTAAIAIAKLAAKAQKEKVKAGKVKTPARYWNFGQVKETMKYVVVEGKAPEGYECDRKELEAIDRFCQWMLKNATGRES